MEINDIFYMNIHLKDNSGVEFIAG